MGAFYITGEESFQVPAVTFAISPSAQGYTPKFSADRGSTKDADQNPIWTSGEAVAAYTNKIVTGNCPAVWWTLDGNASTVKIVY